MIEDNMFVNLSNMIPTSIFAIVVALFVVPSLQESTPFFIKNMCVFNSGTYTNGSSYQHNLLAVLSSLETNSSSSPFYETSATGSKDLVYGRYYCRHDIPLSTCTTCVKAATKQVVANCSPAKEAIIWYEHCTLLYLNSSIRVADFYTWMPSVQFYNAKSNVTDPEKFYPVLMSTMDRIINESAYGTGFATAEAKVSTWKTLYSLAQCSWDLEGLMCERCLRWALHELIFCCKDSVANAYFFSNCQLRYVVGAPFYDSPPSTSPAPSSPVISQDSSGDHPQPPGNRADARSSSNVFKIGLVIAFITLTFLSNQYYK